MDLKVENCRLLGSSMAPCVIQQLPARVQCLNNKLCKASQFVDNIVPLQRASGLTIKNVVSVSSPLQTSLSNAWLG